MNKRVVSYILGMCMLITCANAALLGRYVLEGSHCAGFDFLNAHQALWYNELQCTYPDKLNITWVTPRVFMTVSSVRRKKSCPPSVRVYKITSEQGGRLLLANYWTGWGKPGKPVIEVYQRLVK